MAAISHPSYIDSSVLCTTISHMVYAVTKELDVVVTSSLCEYLLSVSLRDKIHH